MSAFEEWHRKRQAATDKFDLREPFIKEYDGTAVDWPAVVALITPEFHALYIAPNKEAFQKFEVSYEKDYEALVMKLRKDDPIRVCARLDFSKDLGWSYPPIIKASLITRLISFDRWSQERKAMRDKQREFVERYDGMVVDWIGFVQDLSSRQSGDEICVNSSPFIKDDSHCDTIWVSAPRGLNLKPLVLKLDRIKVQGKRAFPNSQFWQAQIEGGTVQRLRGFSDSD